MPPKKKLKETRSNTDTFLLGQTSPTPATMTKPLTNGDLVRYLHHRKELEANKSTSWENLFCCPLISGTTEANCHTKGCKFKGGDDLCGVSFVKHTGGWLKTGLPLKPDRTVKQHIMHIFKDWQGLNKLSSRLCKPDLTDKQKELVKTFKHKMDSTFIIADDNAEEIIA